MCRPVVMVDTDAATPLAEAGLGRGGQSALPSSHARAPKVPLSLPSRFGRSREQPRPRIPSPA